MRKRFRALALCLCCAAVFGCASGPGETMTGPVNETPVEAPGGIPSETPREQPGAPREPVSMAIIGAPIELAEFFADLPENTMVAFATGYDYAVASTVAGMAERAAYIVAGRYTGLDSEHVTNRTTRVFGFQIDEVIKGEIAENEILVSQTYSERREHVASDMVIDEYGMITKEPTWQKSYLFDEPFPFYVEPELDRAYLLFLNKSVSGVSYQGPEPFMLRLPGDGTVRLQSNIFTTQPIDTQSVYSQLYEIAEYRYEDGAALKLIGTRQRWPDEISGMTPEDVLREITG